jgi:metal-responsive CopG/Arc/MetJ family transcriptional regulator
MGLKIEIIKEQIQSLMTQRDNYAQMYQQCVGAISVLSEQLKMVELEDESNIIFDEKEELVTGD